MKKTLLIGEINNCNVNIHITLIDGELSMTGYYRKLMHQDYYMVGQIYGQIREDFKTDKKVQEICDIWQRWHLNHLCPGSPAQTQAIINAREMGKQINTYEETLACLTEIGLNPDPNFKYEGEPYNYGQAWLTEELPPEVVNTIKNW